MALKRVAQRLFLSYMYIIRHNMIICTSVRPKAGCFIYRTEQRKEKNKEKNWKQKPISYRSEDMARSQSRGRKESTVGKICETGRFSSWPSTLVTKVHELIANDELLSRVYADFLSVTPLPPLTATCFTDCRKMHQSKRRCVSFSFRSLG